MLRRAGIIRAGFADHPADGFATFSAVYRRVVVAVNLRGQHNSLGSAANASGGRTQGVGVRFPNDEKTRVLKLKIEEILGTSLQSSKPTQTV